MSCTTKEGGYLESACDALKSYVSYHPTSKSKGLFAVAVVNVKTHEHKGLRITLRTGSLERVTLNYCPFCGKPVRDFKNDL